MELPGEAAVGVLGEGQEPLPGRGRFGAVLVQALEVAVHERDRRRVLVGGGEPRHELVDLGQVAVPLGRQRQVPG
jgi:hypothetical protein